MYLRWIVVSVLDEFPVENFYKSDNPIGERPDETPGLDWTQGNPIVKLLLTLNFVSLILFLGLYHFRICRGSVGRN